MSNSHSRGDPDLAVLPPTPRPGSSDRRLEDEIDFSAYGRFLLRYWIPLALCSLAGLIVGFVVAERRPTLYEAGTTLLAHRGGSPVDAAKILALVQNGTVASETVRQTGLDRDPFRLSPQAFVATAVRVDAVAGTEFVRVVVTLPDPDKAAAASGALARAAVTLNQQFARDEATAIRTHVEEQLAAATDRLRKAEQALLTYQNQAQVEVLRTDTESMLEEHGQLVKLLVDVQAEKTRLAAAEKEIQNHKPTIPLRRPAGSAEVLRRTPAAETPTSAVELEGLDLSDPFVNPIHQTLALQIALSRIRLAALERERQERSRLAGPGATGGKGLAKLRDLHRHELEIARLSGEYDLARQVHAGLLVRYQQAPGEAFNRMISLQVVDEPVRPDRPKPKKHAQLAILGLVIGSLIGLGGILGWEVWRRTSRSTAAA